MNHDVNYIDRTLTARDNVFGEDSLSTYNKQQTIEMYVEDADMVINMRKN